MDENKPLSVALDDLKKLLTYNINTSGIPLYLVKYVLNDIVLEVNVGAEKILQAERQTYNKSVKESEKDELQQDNVGE